jgi:hypothetical protein
MLSNEALNSAMPLTSVLDSADLKITPLEGSPLAELVKATRVDDNFSLAVGNEFSPSIPDITYMANVKDPVLGCSAHDVVMDEVTTVAIKAVQEHIAFARTVVAPAVEDLVTKTMQTLSELTPSSLLGMEVITWNPAAPLQNPGFDSMVRVFESTAFSVPGLRMRLPTLSVAEIKELMKTGSKTLDGDVEAWLAGKGDSFLINIWESVFQIKQAELNAVKPLSFRDFTEDKENGADNALAIFLLARRLLDEPPAGTEMSMNVYADLMADFRNQAGARLCRELDILAGVAKNKLLVKSVAGTKTIVYGSVYKAWIEAGGSNEVLYGNMLELPAVATVEKLNEKAEALKIKWNRHATLTATADANRKYLRTKDALLRHFVNATREIGDDGFEAATVGNREGVIAKFRELLDATRDDELKDLWGTALKLVCRSRFARTEAERILGGIERIKRDNPAINVREAAAVSVIEYVAWWLSRQFKVEGVK